MKIATPATFVLWFLVCCSALAVIYSNHAGRQLFVEWQQLLGQHRQAEVEWGQLLIEKSSLTSYSRLEHLAAEKLNMAVPETNEIKVIYGVKK